jgi:hypothetical protein
MTPLIGTHRGYTITHDGHFFEISLDGVQLTIRPRDLAACEAWIDRQLKQEFIRTRVIVSGYGDNINQAEATSLVDGIVYVVYDNGKRERARADQLRTLSDENIAKIALFKELSAKAEALIKEAESVKDSLTIFDVNSMIK